MPIITLTTDLGTKGYYASAVKGSILTELPEATVIDITHEIAPFDILQASFVVKNSYRHFPAGTIHIIGINAQPDPDSPFLAIEYDNHYFIGNDTGIFSLIFDKKPDKIFQLTLQGESDLLSFPVKGIFVKAACHLARKGDPAEIGREVQTIKEKIHFRPHIDKNTIRGMIIYIDPYENVICNISKKDFEQVSQGRNFSILVRGNSIESISPTYNNVPEGEILALFSSSGFLELAMNRGRISSLLGLKLGDIITIEFN